MIEHYLGRLVGYISEGYLGSMPRALSNKYVPVGLMLLGLNIIPVTTSDGAGLEYLGSLAYRKLSGTAGQAGVRHARSGLSELYIVSANSKYLVVIPRPIDWIY